MTIEQQRVAAEQLAAKQSALQENNRLQMDELLKPIKEQFADFKKSVEESKTQNEVNKKELQNTFEATMKLFQQEQQQAVSESEGADLEDRFGCSQSDQGFEGRQQDAGRLGRDGAGNHPGEQRTCVKTRSSSFRRTRRMKRERTIRPGCHRQIPGRQKCGHRFQGFAYRLFRCPGC